MKNQQLGNMAAKVEMVHIIHNALVLCVIDPGGGEVGWVIYYMKLEVLESNSNLLFPEGGGRGNLLHKTGSA